MSTSTILLLFFVGFIVVVTIITAIIRTREYFFYQKTKDGGFIPGKVSVSNNTTIFEFEPTVVTKPHIKKFSDRYEFFIPKGSLKENYKV